MVTTTTDTAADGMKVDFHPLSEPRTELAGIQSAFPGRSLRQQHSAARTAAIAGTDQPASRRVLHGARRRAQAAGGPRLRGVRHCGSHRRPSNWMRSWSARAPCASTSTRASRNWSRRLAGAGIQRFRPGTLSDRQVRHGAAGIRDGDLLRVVAAGRRLTRAIPAAGQPDADRGDPVGKRRRTAAS